MRTICGMSPAELNFAAAVEKYRQAEIVAQKAIANEKAAHEQYRQADLDMHAACVDRNKAYEELQRTAWESRT